VKKCGMQNLVCLGDKQSYLYISRNNAYWIFQSKENWRTTIQEICGLAYVHSIIRFHNSLGRLQLSPWPSSIQA